jgi:tetratricopeptide (TPR) repeat protein
MLCVAANAQFSSVLPFCFLARPPFRFATSLRPLKLFAHAACLRVKGLAGFRGDSSGAGMNSIRALPWGAKLLFKTVCILALPSAFFAPLAHAQKLTLPGGASAVLDKIYSFDIDGAIVDAQRLQSAHPDHPLGYLLEAEALWWKIFCTSAEFKYGMTDARHRPKLAADQHYQDLVTGASSIALAQLKDHETAEMQFYAGLADAFSARFYGLRGENRASARSGVHAREHFLRAIQLAPQLTDADFGLGLYNYYADTLSAIARLLSFFMGIPGGNKQEGIRQLESDIADGVLTSASARFYLAMDLHRYDQQYEKALIVIGPLAEKYPSNPLFQLARGDLYAKLGRKQQAVDCYRAAAALPVPDAECRTHIEQLVSASLAAQGVVGSSATH